MAHDPGRRSGAPRDRDLRDGGPDAASAGPPARAKGTPAAGRDQRSARGKRERPTRPKEQTVAEARAEAQARAKAARADTASALAEHFGDRPVGPGIVQFALASTAVFTVATLVAAIGDTRSLRIATAVLDVVLFVVGCVLFLVALYVGAQRSRERVITMSGLWFLSGSAPPRVRTVLLANVAVQTVVAFVGASIRFGSSLAFGILVPTLGIALCGLWGARHGMFPERPGAPERRRP